MPMPASRGGATGKSAKIGTEIIHVAMIVSRRRTYSSFERRYIQMSAAGTTSSCAAR